MPSLELSGSLLPSLEVSRGFQPHVWVWVWVWVYVGVGVCLCLCVSVCVWEPLVGAENQLVRRGRFLLTDSWCPFRWGGAVRGMPPYMLQLTGVPRS